VWLSDAICIRQGACSCSDVASLTGSAGQKRSVNKYVHYIPIYMVLVKYPSFSQHNFRWSYKRGLTRVSGAMIVNGGACRSRDIANNIHCPRLMRWDPFCRSSPLEVGCLARWSALHPRRFSKNAGKLGFPKSGPESHESMFMHPRAASFVSMRKVGTKDQAANRVG
jgi:hypothetical protein